MENKLQLRKERTVLFMQSGQKPETGSECVSFILQKSCLMEGKK